MSEGTMIILPQQSIDLNQQIILVIYKRPFITVENDGLKKNRTSCHQISKIYFQN